MTRPGELRSFGVAMAAILAAGVVMGHLQPTIAADEVEASASSLETLTPSPAPS